MIGTISSSNLPAAQAAAALRFATEVVRARGHVSDADVKAVVVADGPDALVNPRPDLDDAVVRVDGRVALDQVVAAYVDNADAEPAVRAAVDVVDEADLGDEDAEFTVGDAQDHSLAWYATQELPFLLELL